MDISALLSSYGTQASSRVSPYSSSSKRAKNSAAPDTDTVDISAEARELLEKMLRPAKAGKENDKAEDEFLAQLTGTDEKSTKSTKSDKSDAAGSTGAAAGTGSAEGAAGAGDSSGAAGGAGGGSGSSGSTESDIDAKIEALQKQISALSGQIAQVLQTPGDDLSKSAQVQPLEQRQSGLIQQLQELMQQKAKQQQQEQKSGK